MIIKKDIDIKAPLTDEQKAMLAKAKDMTIVYDEDCLELSDDELVSFVRVPKW